MSFADRLAYRDAFSAGINYLSRRRRNTQFTLVRSARALLAIGLLARVNSVQAQTSTIYQSGFESPTYSWALSTGRMGGMCRARPWFKTPPFFAGAHAEGLNRPA